MEWITVTAPSVSEAKDILLDKLGVPDGEAEFDVEDEGESKFFGLRKTEARVRARVVPKGTEPRRERKKIRSDRGSAKNKARGDDRGGPSKRQDSGGGQKQRTAAASPGNRSDSNDNPRRSSQDQRPQKKSRPKVEKKEIAMEQVLDNTQRFLDGLLTAFDIDERAEIEKDEDNLVGHVRGQHGVLIGPKARTLDAIQEIAKIAAFKGGTSPARLKIDVGSYRAKRAEALGAFAEKAAAKAIDDQTEVVLEPMSSADRKVVHDALSAISGITTRSVGTDPNRRVVLAPSEAGDDEE